jgi:hypothetical protein
VSREGRALVRSTDPCPAGDCLSRTTDVGLSSKGTVARVTVESHGDRVGSGLSVHLEGSPVCY